MVVLDKLPGLEVNIEVDGVKVQEYNDDEEVEVKPGRVGEHQASRTVSKYIEAIDGAEFSIKCFLPTQFKMNAPNIQVDVAVDSNYAQGRLIPQCEAGSFKEFQGPRMFHPSSGNAAGRWTLQKYRFSKLDISNEETRLSSLNKDKTEAEKVGTIEISIWRVSETIPVAAASGTSFRPKSSSNSFHEKALKGQAKSHKVSYSAGIPVGPQTYATAIKLDGEDYPIAIYRFKYRSKEALKQLLIIERTPEPEDSPTPDPAPDVDLEDLTPAQRERVRAFLRNEGVNAGGASDTPERKIKRERNDGEDSNQARRKKSKITQVIDLTADSDGDE
ncbi:hypothetical protein SBOR_2637 [Sclerotinia borealis F-4128]|uniref:DUF7918 domain-containing protein n=1 Tax=Sclerotinia borealis (strain F-4128) TaxID=1432307 RepID=W9CR43_SCLBF|nr:hypothetical protein SBOR_2637 [Sclerotinia borealis F-4128]